jgi:DNA repair protein RecO (recombination protein O)
MEVEHQNKRDLHRIRETRQCYPLNRLFTDPVKNALALFIAEVLFRVVKDTEADTRLFDYLYRSIYLLELAEGGVANFHVVFLLHLLHYLGIFPNTDSYAEGYYFDMQNGVFADQPPLHRHYLNREESQIFARLFKISYENMTLYTFSRHDRVNILTHILTYYRIHLPEIPEIKSLTILQALFG